MEKSESSKKEEMEIKKKEILEILEDDDEFEEFEREGLFCWIKSYIFLDWDEEMEDLEDSKQWYDDLNTWLIYSGKRTGMMKNSMMIFLNNWGKSCNEVRIRTVSKLKPNIFNFCMLNSPNFK